MKEFNICFGNELSILCFYEIFESIYSCLLEMGYPCSVSTGLLECDKINIILDYHRMQYCEGMSEFVYIPYQFEQLSDECGFFNVNTLNILKNATCVFDYSAENLQFLHKKGIAAIHLPIGFHPLLKRIVGKAEKEIDVLFYGEMNDRRQLILDILSQKKLKVMSLRTVYGVERDDYISRSKIVLNIHYYPMGIMEVARIFYLLINNIFVLSESSTVNPLRSVGLFTVDYEVLVNSCVKFVKDDALREEIALKNAFLFERQFNMKRSLTGALNVLRNIGCLS